MYTSIKLGLVSVLFVISSSTAHQDLIILGAHRENDICNKYPYSICQRICPTAIEDIMNGRHLRICSLGVDEPIVCCVLERIRRVQGDSYGLPWNSFANVPDGTRELPQSSWSTLGNVPSDSQKQPCSSFGRHATGTRDPSWIPLRSIPSHVPKQPYSSFERVPPHPRDPSWNPLGNVPSHVPKLPYSSTGRDPLEPRYPLWYPLESVQSHVLKQPYSLFGRVSPDPMDPSWNPLGNVPSHVPKQPYSSSGRDPCEPRDPLWYPLGSVPSYVPKQTYSSSGRDPPEPRDPSWYPLESLPSYVPKQPYSSPGRDPPEPRDPSWYPLDSVPSHVMKHPFSSSGRDSNDTRDPVWNPSDTLERPWSSSQLESTNAQNSFWNPYERAPYGTQWPLRVPTGYILMDVTGREPIDTQERTPSEPLAEDQAALPKIKQFSDPEATTPDTSFTLPAYTPPPPIPGIENTVSVKKCQEYGQICSRVRDYVAGGFPAEPRELPHMALIGFGSENKKSWKCSGSVISRRYILSAAHCTYPGDSTGYAKWVRLGDLDYTSLKDGAQPKDYTIIEWINHPGYNPPQLYNDIALYKVDKKITFTDFIQPICLHTSFDISDSMGKAAGWGRIEFVGPTSNHLMYTNISFVNPEKCKDNLENRLSKNLFPNGVTTNSIVCAGEDDGNRDTCQGDSGGPLFIAQKDPWPVCLYRQVGITSTGLPCRQRNSPGLYTRISSYIPWIESIVWANEP